MDHSSPTEDQSGDALPFRDRLDAVLQQRDPQALRAFLVAEGEWPETTTMDPEAAMWMMIAASPSLRSLHAEAAAWLASHGRGSDAALLRSKDTAQQPRERRPARPQGRHRKPWQRKHTPRR